MSHKPILSPFKSFLAAALVTLAFALQLAVPPALRWGDAVIFLERAFMITGVLWLAASGGVSLLAATLAYTIGLAILAGVPSGLLAVVAGFLVHAGRVLHSTPVARVIGR